MTIPRSLFDLAGVEARIHHLPGRDPFIIDAELAEVYGTSTGALNRAVKRNQKRFPARYCFRLTADETAILKSQNGISTKANRELPLAFTHAGSYAVSAVLSSETAIAMGIVVFDAFAAMERQALEEARFLLDKLRGIDVLAKKPVYIRIQQASDKGWSFEHLFRSTHYTRYQLEMAIKEMLAIGLLDKPLPGTPGTQADLFARED